MILTRYSEVVECGKGGLEKGISNVDIEILKAEGLRMVIGARVGRSGKGVTLSMMLEVSNAPRRMPTLHYIVEQPTMLCAKPTR